MNIIQRNILFTATLAGKWLLLLMSMVFAVDLQGAEPAEAAIAQNSALLAKGTTKSPPNLVFILADDLGWKDLTRIIKMPGI